MTYYEGPRGFEHSTVWQHSVYLVYQKEFSLSIVKFLDDQHQKNKKWTLGEKLKFILRFKKVPDLISEYWTPQYDAHIPIFMHWMEPPKYFVFESGDKMHVLHVRLIYPLFKIYLNHKATWECVFLLWNFKFNYLLSEFN